MRVTEVVVIGGIAVSGSAIVRLLKRYEGKAGILFKESEIGQHG
jgi:hypothetical protein